MKKSKTVKYIKYLFQKNIDRIKLVYSYLTLTKKDDLDEWRSDNSKKNLLTVLVEWFIEKPVYYGFVGCIISFALRYWDSWYGFAVWFWLLFKVIRSWKTNIIK